MQKRDKLTPIASKAVLLLGAKQKWVEQGPDEPVARALNQLTWISNALELLLLFEIERQADNFDVDLESLRDEVRASGLKSFEDEMNKPNNPTPE